ncbi:MAG: VWA domain-containing protein [Acidobacteriota bacterium]|nr:VWA domain-containing protein [Acidobacteriota bacterium]
MNHHSSSVRLLLFVTAVTVSLIAPTPQTRVSLAQSGRRTTTSPSEIQTPTPTQSQPQVPSQVPPRAPATTNREAQDEIKVYTEEVRIPVFAYDEYERFDPTLEMRDLLVLEDDVAQEVKSLRRVPASVLLLLGTGGEMNMAMRTSTTRDIALNLVANIRAGDQLAVMQFANRTELLQDWTADREQAAHVLRSKLSSGRGSRLAEAISRAALRFEGQPAGHRHVVLVTDGVDLPPRADYREAINALGGHEATRDKAALAEAVRRLNAAQATVHVISYTVLTRLTLTAREQREKQPVADRPGSVASSGIATIGIDPTLPPGMSRGGAAGRTAGAKITFDPEMRRLRKAYESATLRSEQQLTTLAEEMGGRIWLPTSAGEMVAQGGEVAREIGSQYVMTYAPRRPLVTSPTTEYRRIRILPRRSGLRLRVRRGYVVAAMR